MMKKISVCLVLVMVLVFSVTSVVSADDGATPSTNDDNRDKGWAHVNQTDIGVQTTTLEFVSARNFWSCFEFRTDGDTTQKISNTNYNTEITDGLYPYTCENGSCSSMTFYAQNYVEVRMAFGGEKDERFGWTTFYVLPLPALPVDVWPNKPDIPGLRNALSPGDPGAITFYDATHPKDGFIHVVWTLTTKENWVWNYEIAGWDSQLAENQLVGMYSTTPFSIIYGDKIIEAKLIDGVYFLDAPADGNWIIIEGLHEGPFAWEDFGSFTRIRDTGLTVLNIGSGRGLLQE